MINNIFFLLLITASTLGAMAFFRVSPTNGETPRVAAQASEAARTASAIPTQEANGISIAVEKITQGAETTTLALTLNNHRFNLAEDRIYDEATLNGKKSLSHAIPGNETGGHHVEAEVVFPKAESGALVITPAENTTIIFDDVWK